MHDAAFRLPCKVHSNAAHGFAEFLIIHLPCKNTPNRRNNSFTLVWRVRVYLKTVNTPKRRVFSTCWAPFFLAIPRVFLQKMASSGGKSLAVGHISGFQIDPKEVLQSFPRFLAALTGVTVLPRRLKSYNRTQIGRSVRASRRISRMTIRYIAVTNSRKTAVEEPVPSMQQES